MQTHQTGNSVKGRWRVAQLVAMAAPAIQVGVATCLLLLILEVLAAAGLRLERAWSSGVDVNAEHARRRESVPYFAARDWSAAMWREWEGAGRLDRYEPFVLWRPAAYHGRYVNVDERGLRARPGRECGATDQHIWMVGGSAVFGLWQPDSLTMAAMIERSLRERGQAVCVENLGTNSYVSTQEVIAVERRLQVEAAPALVIFYDGYNDATAMDETHLAGSHSNLEAITRRYQARHEGVRHGVGTPLRATSLYRVAERIVAKRRRADAAGRPVDAAREGREVEQMWRAYATNVRTMAHLASGFGFRFEAFWQPSLYHTGKALSGPERQMADLPPATASFVRASYARAERGADSLPNFTYLGSALDSVDASATLFVDDVHVTPEANEVLVERILRRLEGAKGIESRPRAH